MHHEEQDPRHHHDLRRRREQSPHHPHEGHFNDFRSRWGEPSPYIHLNHQGDWHPEDRGRFEDSGRYHHNKEEWLPNQQHRERQHRHPEQNEHREPIWRQRDVYFDRSNQRVEDRWYEDPLMPHPHRDRRRRPESWDENWDERRH